jgi:voltage-gated potassium channel
MSSYRPNKSESTITNWQIVMLFLCVYVLFALALDTIFKLPEDVSRLLGILDNFICIVFIGDFFYNVFQSSNKLAYLKWGWIDSISSIPNVQILRWGRFVRVFRIIKILRGVRSTKLIFSILFANRAKGVFTSVTLISFLLMIFSTIAILNCETGHDSNIKTASDALWWSFVTITTVGYGDYYPTTVLGRIIAAVLMICGVGLFGTFTATVASYFVKQQDEDETSELKLIKAQLEEIKHKIDQLD